MTGEAEPAPTTADGEAPKEEAGHATEVEKLDEAMAEVKEDEGGDKAIEEPQEAAEKPEVEESAIEVPVAEPAADAPATIEQKQQEKVDDPTYTLEIVGNRYNTSNFW